MAAYIFKHEGKTYELPGQDEIKPGVFRKARRGVDDLDKTFILLEEVLKDQPEILAMFDDMPPKVFNDILTGWLNGAQVGESSSFSN